MNKRNLFSLLAITGLMGVGVLAGCTNNSSVKSTINVVTREDGSGTHGAFTELFGLTSTSKGKTIDTTTSNATVANSTSVVLTTVAGDSQSIGYVSLGSLNDTVKAVSINGAKPTADNVTNGSYKISRPFNIVTKSNLSSAAQDFMNYILSSDGQAVVKQDGFIPVSTTSAYQSSATSDKVTVSGSSSVTPVMEKLKEAYAKVNSGVMVEIQQSDSSTGITNVIDGTSDVGMASCDLTDSEKSQGVTPTVIATDGIAVIVNKNNSVSNLTTDQVKNIFSGKTTSWSDATK